MKIELYHRGIIAVGLLQWDLTLAQNSKKWDFFKENGIERTVKPLIVYLILM